MSSLIEIEQFRGLFKKGNMEITDKMYEDFYRYADFLCERNKYVNLTAVTEPHEIAVKHFFDSVYPFILVNVPRGTFIDVGTGAGFPSVPLKIYDRNIRITLLDSLNKRVNFLKELSEMLDLDAKCIHGRAEETARFVKEGNLLRESFDTAAARAVTRLRELSEYCLPFVKVGGSFIALKGRDTAEEIAEAKNAIGLMGGEISECKEYTLPNGDSRTVIVIGKVKSTPEKYPRNSGQMKKKPL